MILLFSHVLIIQFLTMYRCTSEHNCTEHCNACIQNVAQIEQNLILCYTSIRQYQCQKVTVLFDLCSFSAAMMPASLSTLLLLWRSTLSCTSLKMTCQ